ncbi:MAG TPA: GH92 family glycosyl hydrolase [Candidatus Hydrogenedentes bacterium]|nr:GH92 family glycosyl hydrolase [Candidatus Hydrogenedentota bacterium]
MKRVFKWIILSMAALLAILFLFVAGLWGTYRYVVDAMPGSLTVSVSPGPLGQYVNVFVATGGIPYMCGHDSPAAAVPFGMVRLGPDTASLFVNINGFNRSGYFYGDNKILGFSHTRLVGADALEGGCFRVFPTVESRVEKMRAPGRYSRFSHRNETAFPGYYAVKLRQDDVLVELTATPHVGMHRYTFPRGVRPHLLLEVTSVLGDKRCEDGVVMIKPDVREIEGSVTTYGSFSGRYGGLPVFFVARCNRPFASYGAWSGDHYKENDDGAAGKNIGVDIGFKEGDAEKPIELQLALSCVSVANARANLEAEAAGKSFGDIVSAAKEAWEQRLAQIRVSGGTEKQQRIFYTSLYRAFQMPTVFTDVNGDFLGFDRGIHKAEGYTYYTDFSLWDTFRTVHPLYNLIARENERDMMVSLVEMTKEGGGLPRWPSGCGYTNCMFGTPADLAVSEAYLKGIRDFDIDTAYKAMRQTALIGRPEGSKFAGREGLEWYLTYTYCPTDKAGDAVSATLEYSWADYALSLLARELGHADDAAIFAEHSTFYKNIWNPETQFFQPRFASGEFDQNFKPLLLSYIDFDRKYTKDFVEGSAMQWRWGVPFDPEGLIALFRSREYFLSELETYMENSTKTVGAWNPGPYYWHGNEPYIHAAYLFSAAGRPDLTQKWVRWILDTKYNDTYFGLDGNDDGGTLSSWYVLSALGFYPIAGTMRYELGSPLFDKAEVRIGDKTLTIIAENNAPANVYVQQVFLNEKVLDHTYFAHDEIAQGGTLRFVMGSNPPK